MHREKKGEYRISLLIYLPKVYLKHGLLPADGSTNCQLQYNAPAVARPSPLNSSEICENHDAVEEGLNRERGRSGEARSECLSAARLKIRSVFWE